MMRFLVLGVLTVSAQVVLAAACPEPIEKMKTAEFLTAEFKWKAPASKEGEEAAALPELDCKSSGDIAVGGKLTPVYQVGLKSQKKRIAVLVGEGSEPAILRGEPKALEDANMKVFSSALPLAKDLTVWRKIVKTDFELRDGDLCAKSEGFAPVVKGSAETCAKSLKKTKVLVPVALGTGIMDPGKAQQVALKEFARLEKEEETPDAKEIFGDKDTVWKLFLGADVKSSYYVFWMSQFSASGVIIMATYMDGTAKSEVVANAFEYDAKLVSSKTTKWSKE